MVAFPDWLRRPAKPDPVEQRRAQYQHHAFDQTLDWDWWSMPFNRIALINLLVAGKPGCRYLEIGCDSNFTFHSVAATRKVGVDPARGGTVRKTSDEFFADNQESFDVIFIDGLHHYQQVRRDVANAVACLAPGGWVVLHDMLPRTWVEHHVPCIDPSMWTGDVWKVGHELAQSTGVDFRIFRIDFGVGVFRLTAPTATLADLRPELADKEFDHYFHNLHRLPLVSWEQGVTWMQQDG